jgi:starch synthase (maltosyl-transferring)
MVVSLNPYNQSQAMIRLPLEHLKSQSVQIVDLITGNSYDWNKEWNYVELNPELPFHLFKIQK